MKMISFVLAISLVPLIWVAEHASGDSIHSVRSYEVAAMIREADRVEFTFYLANRSDLAVTRREWIESFADVVGSSTFVESPLCLCSTYPELDFFSGDRRLFRITVHHGSNLLVSGSDVSGYFVVGEKVVDQILDHIREIMALIPDPIDVAPNQSVEAKRSMDELYRQSCEVANKPLETIPDSLSQF